MSSRVITKKRCNFTIDIETVNEFDRLVPNNEKSLQVELMIKELVSNNPNGVKSLKPLGWLGITEKRGIQYRCVCKKPCSHSESERAKVGELIEIDGEAVRYGV